MSDKFFEVTFENPLTAQSLMESLGIQEGGRVQQAIDGTVIELCMDYCPWRTGKLAHSPYYNSESGMVVYKGPSATELYYGEVSGYNTSKNALAGPFWADRMKADHIEDITEAAVEAMKGDD